MNGSSVTPKMAGTLSTAKSKSVPSTTNKTRNSGVTQNFPASRTKNRLPCSCCDTGNSHRPSRMNTLRSGSILFSDSSASLKPV